MDKKQKTTAVVVSQQQLAEEIYDLRIRTKSAQTAVPGQFVSLYSADKSRLLPRPISICEIDKTQEELRLVYRVAGKGTKEFSQLESGDTLEILGPLGNGFPLTKGHVLLVGGGIGIPPMLETAKQCGGVVQAVLGYANAETFLAQEFESHALVTIATDDGSIGTHGTVLDAIAEKGIEADVILACGPKPMLKALADYAMDRQIPCYVSMEERMACGIGACLACVCNTTQTDAHSQVKNRRICRDGPVFPAEEVDFS